MRGASRCYAVLLIVVTACFGFGLFRLFVLRFEKGDIYPPYSSLRSDPLGSKALYRSLEGIPGIRVERGFIELAQWKNLQGTTVLLLGEDEAFFKAGKKEREALEALAFAGNRLVVGFLPRINAKPAETEKKCGQAEEKGKGKDEKAKPPGTDAESGKRLADKWEVAPGHFPDTGKGESLLGAPADHASPALPGKLLRHSTLFFKLAGSDWRTIYSSGGEPVVIERRIGKGSIVLLGDCYPLSNEALRGEPDASLLVWIIGDNRSMLFDEFHLGVGDPPGVGTLVRRYRMESFLAGLLILALLYIWKNSVPFLRVLPVEASGARAGGKDNFSGLVNLLRRAVSRDKLLDVCFQEWRRSFSREYREQPEKLAQVEALLKREAALPARQRDVAAAYRSISGLLAKKRRER